MMLLFSIPVVGWIACIIMALASQNKTRQSFAKAMLIFLIIGAILSIMCGVLFSWVWEAVVESFQGYAVEAAGSGASDFAELEDMFDIIGGLGELDLSSLQE
jgi:Na+/melibiose symporter-like transporter